jgi:prepilin-type processing-associated H-X9-DG protein
VPVVPALLAIGLGIAGLIKARRPNVSGKGIAILGMSIAVAAMAMHALIVITAIPKIKTVIAVGKRVVCTAHLAVIEQALEQYTKDNNGAYPDSMETLMLASPNLHPTILICPSTNDTAAPGATSTEQAKALKTPGHFSYVYVGKGKVASTQPSGKQQHSDVVILYEPPSNHGNGGMNVLWGDGRISYVDKSSAATIVSELTAGRNPPTKPPGGWKSESDGLIPD